MNGPVAMAGSIPLLSKNRGMKVPIIPATIITITNEIEIARATKYSSPEIIINKNKITDKITPLTFLEYLYLTLQNLPKTHKQPQTTTNLSIEKQHFPMQEK